MTLLEDLLDDLDAETRELRERVDRADQEGWTVPTEAAGWTVATQVAHLAWTDEVAVVAATDRTRWDELLLEAMADPTGFVDAGALALAELPRAEVLARWDAAHAALAVALRDHPPGQKLPWFGPPMSPASMATARFMETWAHAQDVYDALGSSVEPTDRIRHVAHLGVRTRGFAHTVHGLAPPADEVRVELTAPSGEVWSWGPEAAEQRVSGSAYDFCLLVTQRVHRDDTDLVAVGDGSEHWLTIAQAFAGPPGGGRPVRSGGFETLVPRSSTTGSTGGGRPVRSGGFETLVPRSSTTGSSSGG